MIALRRKSTAQLLQTVHLVHKIVRSCGSFSVIVGSNHLPAVCNLKYRAEIALHEAKSDLILFNESRKGGITDMSFEKRESKKGVKNVVSINYEMNEEGIKSYRKAATALADLPTVELHYTPHFGQSRITFEWDTFFEVLSDRRLGLSQDLPQLMQLPAPVYNEVITKVDSPSCHDIY